MAAITKNEYATRVFLKKLRECEEPIFETTLLGEINSLLGLNLDCQGERTEDYELFLDDLAARTADAIMNQDNRVAAQDTFELISLLTTGGERNIRGLIHDMAQILFLERERRSEYVNNTQVAHPYNIHKLMLEYAMKSRHVDHLVGDLTKRFCATSCPKLPTGCCYILGYDLGLVPKTMLRLQAIESRRHGHLIPTVEEKCKYHTRTGCTLSLFKTPACIRYLCDDLIESLEATYPRSDVADFLTCLETFGNCHIDRSKVFAAMDGVIASGRKLVAFQGPGTPSRKSTARKSGGNPL